MKMKSKMNKSQAIKITTKKMKWNKIGKEFHISMEASLYTTFSLPSFLKSFDSVLCTFSILKNDTSCYAEFVLYKTLCVKFIDRHTSALYVISYATHFSIWK